MTAGANEPEISRARLEAYLNFLVEEHLATCQNADQAREAWQGLHEYFNGNLSVPAASSGPDGQILLTWDDDLEHLEMEFILNEATTIFSMNRSTGLCQEQALDGKLVREIEILFGPFLLRRAD
jgi:hypothetical protein